MATALGTLLPSATYTQLLHVDGALSSTLKSILDGSGAASAVKISTTQFGVDNLVFDGNTISSSNTNGNIVLAPDGSGAVQIANVAITGGSITGITDLAVADGGTGASTAADARTNLGLGTLATQNATAATITGGTVTPTTALGIGTGGGGTVTQATNKSTGVTLNTPAGQITMNNASLNSATAVSFTLTSSAIGANDVVVVSIKSAATAGAYTVTVDAVAAGSCQISVRNNTGGSLGEALVLNYVVLKGATS